MKPLYFVAALLISSSSFAQTTLTCSDFVHNPNGSWSPKHPVVIQGGGGSISMSPGVSFNPGTQFMGLDLAAALNAQCGSQ